MFHGLKHSVALTLGFEEFEGRQPEPPARGGEVPDTGQTRHLRFLKREPLIPQVKDAYGDHLQSCFLALP